MKFKRLVLPILAAIVLTVLATLLVLNLRSDGANIIEAGGSISRDCSRGWVFRGHTCGFGIAGNRLALERRPMFIEPTRALRQRLRVCTHASHAGHRSTFGEQVVLH